MLRFLLFILLISASIFPQASANAQEASPQKEKGWIQHEFTKIKVFPYRDKAYQYLKENKPALAVPEFEKVLAVDPTDTAARMDYCQALFDLERYDDAVIQARHILDHDPDNAQALVLGTQALMRNNRENEAIKMLDTALSDGVLDAQSGVYALNTAVDLLAKTKHYDRLLTLLERRGDALAPSRRAYLAGLAHVGLHQPEKARMAYEKALMDEALDTEDRLVALSDLADILLDQGKPDAARSRLLEAYSLDPSLASVSYRLAELTREAGQYDEALVWIDRSLQAEQGTNPAMFKAFILADLGRGRDALEVVTSLATAADNPVDKADLLVKKGFLADRFSYWAEAEHAFADAVALVPSRANLTALAAAQNRAGHPKQSLKTYHRILAMRQSPPQRAGVQLDMAVILDTSGDLDSAAATYREAIDSGDLPDFRQAEALENLGFLRYRQKNYLAAEQAFKEALEFQPDSRKLQLSLARTYFMAGKFVDAEAVLKPLADVDGQYDTFMLLAESYEKEGRDEAAIGTYQTMLNRKVARGDRAAAVLEQMASYKKRQGAMEQAGRLYARAYLEAKHKNPEMLMRAGESYFSAGRYDAALDVLKQYRQAPGVDDDFTALNMMGFIQIRRDRLDDAAALYRTALLSGRYDTGERTSFLINLGSISFAQNRNREGVRYMRRAIRSGGETASLRLEIGQALYRVGEYQDAVDELLRSRKLGAGYKADMALAFSYDKLGKPGLALHYMKEAERMAPESVLRGSAELYDQLAYLCMSEESFAEAARYYRHALAIADSQLRFYLLGRALRLNGEPDEAEAAFARVQPEDLDTGDRAQFHEELGRIAMGRKQYSLAQERFRQSLDVESNSERVYLLGQAQDGEEDYVAAIDSYERADSMDRNDMYEVSLGYAHYKNGDLEQAASIFEDLQSRDPDYIKLVEDLAYINKQLYRNEESVKWFKASIDNEELYPGETEKSLRKKIYDFKEEVRNLTNRWNVSGYYSYAVDQGGSFIDGQNIHTGVLNNAAGVEVGYVPEDYGFRNGKIFQYIGRLSFNRVDNGPFSFDNDTMQGALGVRYKPFSWANIAVGAEKLFQIGADAEDNTVLRLMGSWDDGWAMRAGEDQWNYTFAFGEVDQYIEDEERAVLTLHVRQGRTWNIDDQWLVTPHIFLTCKAISPDRDDDGHIIGGPAVSVRWLEGEDRYVSYKREWELLVGFNYGRYLEGNSYSISGMSVNLTLNF